MKKKIPIILGLVWLIVAAALYGVFIWHGQPNGVYTYENDGCTVEQKVYVTDNEKNEGRIFEMDPYGKVSAFFTTKKLEKDAFIHKIASYDRVVYALMEVPESAKTTTGYAYRILKFQDGLNLTAMTPLLSINETDQVTNLVVDDQGLYLATVSRDGSAACVYEVSYDQLMDLETAVQSTISLESFLRQEAVAGRELVASSYEMGNISVRSDADLASGPFAINKSIRYTYSLCHMNFGQLMVLHGNYCIYLVFGVLVGWLIIFLFHILLHNRNRVVYLTVVLETILFVVIMGGSGVFAYKQAQADEKTKTKWASAMLNQVLYDVGNPGDLPFTEADFYLSEEYTMLRERLKAAYAQTVDEGCVDLFFADTTNLCVAVSVSGHNQETVDARYFADRSGEAEKLIVPNSIVSHPFVLNGQKYQILSATAGDVVENNYALFAVYRDNTWSAQGLQDELVRALILFALASFLCILILSLQSADLGKLAHSMQRIAVGKTDVVRPRVYGGDMRILWNSLGEIQNKIRKVNYSKYITFEAYYRFAPKNIERLLNKESITEVASGDVTKLDGTMALISTVGPKNGSEQEIGRLNRLLELIGRYQEEKDGVFLSNDGSLSMLRFLFMENSTSTLNSSIDFLHELEEQETGRVGIVPRTTILLHYSSFVYGIAGTNQQSASFLVSQETDEIEHFATWFRERGLRLVISETVREREKYDGSLRCIGYIQMADNSRMNMYEVLDVLDAREREKKRAVCERFSQALELFYQYDFYLARSAFSDILKELPTDEIAKWYLFTCETYLNMEHTENVSCGLHYER
ncbi:MAG: hypothetical protein PUD20_08575 [bacterium]|nr:hypothetical protein [bacterium]